MFHNQITTACITPTDTPLVYAMFHDLVFNTKKERVVVTPEMFGISLILNYENRIPETREEMLEITEKVFPNAKFYGFVARETPNSINLWHDRITIYKPSPNGFFGNKYEMSKINWAAIGSTEIAEAELFAKIMLEATYIAKQMDANFLEAMS